jgi:hypothetical protein
MVLFFLATEYINVAVMGNTEGYPWGCKCFPGMDNYANPEIYARSLLYEMFIPIGIFIVVCLLWRKYLRLPKQVSHDEIKQV